MKTLQNLEDNILYIDLFHRSKGGIHLGCITKRSLDKNYVYYPTFGIILDKKCLNEIHELLLLLESQEEGKE